MAKKICFWALYYLAMAGVGAVLGMSGKRCECEAQEPVEVIQYEMVFEEPAEEIIQPLIIEPAPVASVTSPEPLTVDEMVEEISSLYGICPELIEAIIEAESEGDPEAVSGCGAIGLMQIIPKWHLDRMDRLDVENLTDPYDNILVGTDYLAELIAKYDDIYIVLMAYNEGEYSGAVQRAQQGDYSSYAREIIARSQELERLHEEEQWEQCMN